MHRLIVYGETIVTMSVRDSYYDPDHIFSSDDGLEFAFAITEYDNNAEPIEDPRYGIVHAKIVSWGFGDTQAVDNDGGYLDLHTCSQDELGLAVDSNDQARFWPVHKNSLRDTELYSKKLKCIDKKVEIQGDYNSAKAKVLKLTFEKCDNSVLENDCHSDEEINEWLRRKFIIVLLN